MKIFLPRNNQLEQLITKNIYNQDNWLVYADWLQTQGDIRGELIILEYQKDTIDNKKQKASIEEKIKDIYQEYIPLWLDTFYLDFPDTMQDFLNRTANRPFEKAMNRSGGYAEINWKWHYGFITSATLVGFGNKLIEQKAHDMMRFIIGFLQLPETLFLQEITVSEVIFSARILKKVQHQNIRKVICYPQIVQNFYNFDPYLNYLPKIKILFPNAHQLVLTGEQSYLLEHELMNTLLINHLTIKDFPTNLPQHIQNNSEPFLTALTNTQLLARLKHLFLINNYFKDSQANVLLKHFNLFKHLQILDLSGNSFSSHMKDLLNAKYGNIIKL